MLYKQYNESDFRSFNSNTLENRVNTKIAYYFNREQFNGHTIDQRFCFK